jgi:hypothetical protein
MKLRLFAICATVVVCYQAAECSAAVVVYYPFGSGTTGSDTATVAANVNSTAFSDADGILNYNTSIGNPLSGGSGPPSVFKSYGDTSDTEAHAIANNEYWSFTVTPNAGFQLSLTDINVGIANDKVTGNQGKANPTVTFFLQASLDGGAFTDITGNNPMPPGGNGLNWIVDLGNYAHLVNSSITFRVGAFDDEGTTNPTNLGVYVDDVTVDGTVNRQTDPPAPEASSLAIWSVLGLAFCGFSKWRGRK